MNRDDALQQSHHMRSQMGERHALPLDAAAILTPVW